MNLSDFIQVGTVYKAHGLKGWLKVNFDHPFLVDKGPKHLFIGKLPKPLPYAVIELRSIDQGKHLLSFEGVDSKELANKLAKKELWLPAEQAETYFDLEPDYDFVGYQLFDQNDQLIGIIDELVEMPMQLLAQVKYNEKDVLIPLTDETIIDYDEDAETIVVEIADGLLDMN